MSKETLIFNIGGVVFETYRSTLLRMPTTLGDSIFLEEHHRADRNDYFFDRDPDVFKVLLNYLRTGQLSITSGTCGPDTKNELLFWGVQPSVIDRCCPANEWRSNTVNQDQQGHSSAEVASNRNTNMIWNVLSKPGTSVAATVYTAVSYVFICLSIFTLVAETTSSFRYVEIIEDGEVTYDKSNFNRHMYVSLVIIDLVCLVFFTAEYITRVVTSPRKLRFVLSCLGIIDLLALLPSYFQLVNMATTLDLRWIRVLAVFRILRLFRICSLLKNMHEMKNLLNTLKASVVEIVLLACLLAVGILVFATLVFSTEVNSINTQFSSIPESFWWAIVTMTTVGYGDTYPMTVIGKIVGSLCAVSGVLMIGLTVAVLVNNAILQSKRIPTSTYTAQPSGMQLTNVTADDDDRKQECALTAPDNLGK